MATVSDPFGSIPPGYQLHIRSWEGDADNYGLEIISGLDEYEVKHLIELAELVDSGGSYGGQELNDEDWQELFEKTQEIQEKNSAMLNGMFKDKWFFDDIDYLAEIIGNLTGNPGEGYWDFEHYLRVCDLITVYLVPSAIQDVTEEFVK